MNNQRSSRGFTLIELLVVISIIAILASIALPVFGNVTIKAAQTQALSNAKQIALACKIFASDNNGVFPTKSLNATTGKPDGADVTTSNDAFFQLFPDYLQSEDIFWVSKSGWCNTTKPDNRMDAAGTYTRTETLRGGENHWAYVTNLNDTSNPSYPLIADGFAAGSTTDPAYSEDETVAGGVWKAKKAIVIRVDGSGNIERVRASDKKVYGPVGGTVDDNIFKTATTWLKATNQVVNPVPRP